MCTVSFVPAKDNIIISSNRDESIHRGITIPPKNYSSNRVTITYPKDEKGLGTWIGYNEFNSMAVLLNGAFENHLHKPPYKHSRGLIIPQILQYSNSFASFEELDLNGIEPFTLLLYGNNQLVQYKWTGTILDKKELSTTSCHLWNSATLYSKQMEEANKEELNHFFSTSISKEEIYWFHQSKKYELQQPENSWLNDIKTISITQIIIQSSLPAMFYHDLLPAPNLVNT